MITIMKHCSCFSVARLGCSMVSATIHEFTHTHTHTCMHARTHAHAHACRPCNSCGSQPGLHIRSTTHPAKAKGQLAGPSGQLLWQKLKRKRLTAVAQTEGAMGSSPSRSVKSGPDGWKPGLMVLVQGNAMSGSWKTVSFEQQQSAHWRRPTMISACMHLHGGHFRRALLLCLLLCTAFVRR